MPELHHPIRGASDRRLYDLPRLRATILRGVITMPIKIEKYIGRVIEIIYQAKDGQLTQRRISVRSVISGKVRAFDVDKRAPRVFEVDRILSAMPVRGAV